MPKAVDISGRRFGRLTAIRRAENAKCGRSRWLCVCDCGAETVVQTNSLVSGHTTSCGCYNGACQTIHGKTNTRLFRIWSKMKSRCFCENDKDFKNYGGRGIRVCDEWKDDFLAFYTWSMENGYRDDLTIDRVCNDGPYAPWNCRWTDLSVQANNRRSNHVLVFGGASHTIHEWSQLLGMSEAALVKRMKYGWDVERVLTTPVAQRKKPVRRVPPSAVSRKGGIT